MKITGVVHAIESFRIVADMINEENAVEMVDFVKKGAGEITTGLEADFGAVFELSFDLDFVRASDDAVNFWYGKTTFVIGLGATFGADDFGVDEGGEGGMIFVFEVIAHNNNALILAELRSGHGGGNFVGVKRLPGEGRFDHVGDDFVGFVSDFTDTGGFGTQARIWGGN